jgi:hypothetical protein
MSYAAIFAASNDEAFQGRCLVACWKAAQDILSEPRGTENYDVRRGWALNILAGTARITPQQLAVQVLRNPTIGQNPVAAQDGDLQFQVNSIISDLTAIG